MSRNGYIRLSKIFKELETTLLSKLNEGKKVTFHVGGCRNETPIDKWAFTSKKQTLTRELSSNKDSSIIYFLKKSNEELLSRGEDFMREKAAAIEEMRKSCASFSNIGDF